MTARIPINTIEALGTNDDMSDADDAAALAIYIEALKEGVTVPPIAICQVGEKRFALNHACRVNMAHFGIEPWTPHDLRRTTGTRLGELGFNRLVQDKVLNHADRTVGGIYDRHSYDGEKSRALAAWERRLGMIVLGIDESADVIDLVRR